MAESFSREKLRQAPQKEGGEILCDPGWYVHKRDVRACAGASVARGARGTCKRLSKLEKRREARVRAAASGGDSGSAEP